MNFEFKSTFKKIDSGTCWMTATVVAALILKYFQMVCTTADLRLLLLPTSSFIELFYNVKNVFNATGYHFASLNICVDKSCSGTNFFIISFCVFSSVVPYVHLNHWKGALLFVGVVLASYCLTIVANTSRILGAVFLMQASPAISWFPHAWVHEAEGALVYLTFLLLFYLFAKFCFNKILNRYAQSA